MFQYYPSEDLIRTLSQAGNAHQFALVVVLKDTTKCLRNKGRSVARKVRVASYPDSRQRR